VAIDYVIAQDCRLKARLGSTGLVQHLKNCMILELAELCADVSLTPKLAAAGSGPATGARAVPPRITALALEVDALARYRDDCASCRASVFSDRRWAVGGCVGFITVPIERVCEDLICEFVEQALGLPEGHPPPAWLDGLVACGDRDLGRWHALRQVYAHGEPEYFERSEAHSMRVAPALGGRALTTDAVWEYLFGVAPGASLGTACAAQFCSDLGTHIGTRLSWARMHALLRDSRSVEEMLEYGSALARAAALGTTAQVCV